MNDFRPGDLMRYNGLSAWNGHVYVVIELISAQVWRVYFLTGPHAHTYHQWHEITLRCSTAIS